MSVQASLFGGRIRAAAEGGLVVDLFAGGGGASTGIMWAIGRSPDLGINHSWDALRNHALNHPDTAHLVDDIRSVSPIVATRGEPVDILWASPDCRDFSRAKGGRPCHPEIRSLPWEVTGWARETRPRLICVENVPEIQGWGPLYEDHSDGCTGLAKCAKGCHYNCRIPEREGETWREWIQAFRDEGYQVAWWVLHAHHYGAPTSRKRIFVVARRDGIAPVKPEPTHGPGLLPFKTAADCIDWSDLGESIFDEDGNTHHAPATLRRIATGVMRYVVEAKQPFIVTCNHGKEGFRGQGLNEPFKTVTASRDAHGLVTPTLVPFVAGVGGRAAQTGNGLKPITDPLNTTTTKNDRVLVVPTLVQTGYGEREGQAPRALDIQKPLGTVVSGGAKHAFVAAFLAKHYGGVVGIPATAPVGTITAKDHHSVVAATLTKFYGTNESGAPADAPLGTVTASAGGGHHGVVAANLIRTDNSSDGRLRGLASPEEPLKTLTTANGQAIVAAFLSTYYGQSVGQPVDAPMATQTTKHRHAVVIVTIDGIDYAIVDIKMRMLKARELKLGQGLPASYRLEGTEKLQVNLIGNSVPPQFAEAVVSVNRLTPRPAKVRAS